MPLLVGTVDADIFAEDVPMADGNVSRGAFVGGVLRRMADGAAGADLIFLADGGQPLNVGIGTNGRSRANLDPRLDNGEGADLGCGINLGFGINDCGWVN